MLKLNRFLVNCAQCENVNICWPLFRHYISVRLTRLSLKGGHSESAAKWGQNFALV